MYVFNEGEYSETYRQYFKNHLENDPWKRLDDILVAVVDNQIVSTVRIFHRKIFVNKQPISMGGIGEVSTKPEFRSQGLATKLLQYAINRMKNQNINISMLGTGKHDFYGRLGWKKVQYGKNIADITKVNSRKYSVRRADFAKDLGQIKEIYNIYSSKFNGTIVRDHDDYWNNWFVTESKDCWVADDKDCGIVGYISVIEKNQQINVKEFGAKMDEQQVFSDLIYSINGEKNKQCKEVIYQDCIKGDFNWRDKEINRDWMVKLITPIKINEVFVENTEQLVSLLNKSDEFKDKRFCIWYTDGF
jgi:predicted acetyltransferase